MAFYNHQSAITKALYKIQIETTGLVLGLLA